MDLPNTTAEMTPHSPAVAVAANRNSSKNVSPHFERRVSQVPATEGGVLPASVIAPLDRISFDGVGVGVVRYANAKRSRASFASEESPIVKDDEPAVLSAVERQECRSSFKI